MKTYETSKNYELLADLLESGAVIAKMGYNQTRPMRHGGKRF